MHHSSPPEAYLRELRDDHTIDIPKTWLYAPALTLRWLVNSVLDRPALFSLMTSSAARGRSEQHVCALWCVKRAAMVEIGAKDWHEYAN